MIDKNSDCEFHVLFGAYLNQDSEYWGDTVEQIVTCYKNDSSPEEISNILVEIDNFRKEARGKLDEVFREAYGFNFDPILWGYATTGHFFDDLKKILITH
ncbi:hypothetical protein LJ656_01270 [Paraburkholderia sp. MMS20-SJTR3]|uniref:CdiI immunity protein domain-containing protein n=1 Tax=Paraburkholderia sejongensis TaxID=2886946 RepID=A0ABS8JMS6_9BURK|nr:contact-dependent growth inhibition system immunity protein [Paraburkholderia sp. MMS20-SJTR3]MCC8391204.1 hypothetical protein [Paraburkholderia sp. MMS20-SJTR3]